MNPLIDRLSRRGKLTIEAEDGRYDVHFTAPFVSLIETHDLFEHCRLGAHNWHGEGDDIDALLVTCEIETRPDTRDVDELRWAIERRRETRTAGPPLPTFFKYGGKNMGPTWRPGPERWLRTSDHKYEYLDGYRRDLETEKALAAESAAWAALREQARVRRVLES